MRMAFCGELPKSEEAPERFDAGRRCAKCRTRVNPYQSPTTDGDHSALLCFRCQRVRRDEDIPLAEFVPVPKRALKKGKREGIYLPGLGPILNRTKITREELAEASGVSYHHICAIARANKKASAQCAFLIADALGVKVGELL